MMSPSNLVLRISARDHVQGNPDALVKLVEYGDYECSYCGEAYAVVKELQRRLGADLCFAFRNFPLTNIHEHAQEAAEAAEAAGAQQHFWEMHDYLYEHQDALESEDLVGYAKLLALDVRKFAEDLATHAHAARVREDFMSGVRSGVNGTPTFYINGIRHDGSFDIRSLLSAIQERMRNAA